MPTEFDPDFFRMSQDASFSDSGADDDLWALLSAYIDGEATPEEAASVEVMLRTDPAYAREFAFLKMASTTAQGMPEVEPPASLRDSIFAATTRRQSFAQRALAVWVDFRHKLTPQVGRYAMPAAAFAGAALVAAVVLPGMFSPGRSVISPVRPGNTDTTRTVAQVIAPTPVVDPNAGLHMSPLKHVMSLAIIAPPVRSVTPNMPSRGDESGSHGVPNVVKQAHNFLVKGPAPKHKASSDGLEAPTAPPNTDVAYAQDDPQRQKPHTLALASAGPSTDVLGPDVRVNSNPAPPVIPPIAPREKKIIVASLTSLSPEMRHIPTGAAIARMSEEARLNYSPEVARGSERGEATVSLVSHF